MNGMPWSFEYKGHPVTHENDRCYIIPTLEGDHFFTTEDMLITGVKGEIYPCKIDIFRATYDPVEKESMSFGQAIEAMKAGKKVARGGWNGKGMFLYYVPEGRYPARTDAAKSIAAEDDKVDYGANIAMKTAQGNVVPWLASQTDMLAEDWAVVW